MLGKPDPSMLFPAETYFTPYSIVRNISELPLTVGVSFTFDTLDAVVPKSDGSGTQSVATNPQMFMVQAIPINFGLFSESEFT
jgi:hypothetical protein